MLVFILVEAGRSSLFVYCFLVDYVTHEGFFLVVYVCDLYFGGS